MIIDFDKLDPLELEHFKGGDGIVTAHRYIDPKMGAIIRLTFPAGSSNGYHMHEGNCEIIYCLSGQGICRDDGDEYTFLPGMCHYCAEGHEHCLINNGTEPLVVLAVLPNTVS